MPPINPPPPTATNTASSARQLAMQFHCDRALSGHHVEIVVRRDEDAPDSSAALARREFGSQADRRPEPDACAQRFDAARLGGRNVRGNVDLRRNAARLRRRRDAKPVVSVDAATTPRAACVRC